MFENIYNIYLEQILKYGTRNLKNPLLILDIFRDEELF
jgi:hypothetical protein